MKILAKIIHRKMAMKMLAQIRNSRIPFAIIIKRSKNV